MAKAGSLTYDTDIDKSGFEKGLNSLKSATKTSIKAIGATIAAATAATAAALVGITKATIDARGEIEQQIGGVQTLFENELGNASDTVIKNANIAYRTAGMSAIEYMSTATSFSASLLQSLGKDTKKAADIADMAIIDMSDNANKMGTSMEAIQNAYQGFAKQNYTMLDNLKLGYGGTKTEMERLLKDAEKITGIKYDISNLSDVYNAIHVIQQELGITGTTAKEATETLQGSMASMNAAWNNFFSGSGDLNQVVDTVKDVIKNVTRIVGEAVPHIIKSVTEALPELLNLGGEILGKIAKGIMSKLPKLVEVVSQIISNLIEGIKNNLPNILSTVLQVALEIITAIGTILPELFKLGIECIVELVNGITQQLPELISTALDCMFLLADTLLDNIDVLIDAGINLLLGLTDGLMEALPKLIDKAPDIIDKLINALVRNLPKLQKVGPTIMLKLATGMIKALPQLLSKIPQIIGLIVSGFISYSSTIVEEVKDFFSPLTDWFGTLFNNITENIKVIWQDISPWLNDNVIESIKTFFQPLFDWFSALFDSITNSIKSFFDVISELANGCVETIKIIWETISGWFNENIVNPISNFFDDMWNKLKIGASGAWEGIKNIFSNITSWFRDKFTQAWQAVKDVFSAGGKIFDGIKDGILNGLKSVINGLISGINKVIKVPFDGINGALNNIRNIEIVGQKPFGGLPRIETPQIPQLAHGISLAKKGHKYLLEGDGNEAVIPLDQDKYWTRAVAMDMLKAINEQKNNDTNNSILQSAKDNQTISLNNKLDGTVILDGTVAGRLLAPSVMKVIKSGGAYVH